MQLHCPHCGDAIQADDVNLEREIAKCRECHAVFSFAGALGQREGPTARSKAREALSQAPPRGFKLDETGPNLVMVRRWFSPLYFGLLIFCVPWIGFLVFWYSMALGRDVPWIMVIFPIGHVAVGVGLAYVTICGFVNSTTITVGDGQLSIQHGPLPWMGNQTLDSSQIEQLYCRERTYRTKHGTRTRYELHAVTRHAGSRKLLSGFDEPEHVLYIEQQLETRLRIKDAPVRGEWGRTSAV